MGQNKVKKAYLSVFVLSLIILFAVATTYASDSTPQTRIKLRFGHIFPATSFQQKEMLPLYFNLVAEATKNKYAIEVEWYPVGTMVGGVQTYDSVVQGIIDIGSAIVAWTPGRFPVLMTLSQPGIAPPVNAIAGSITAWEFFNHLKPAECADTKILAILNTPPGWIHSKAPIFSIKDLKNKNILATGGPGKAVKILGGNPITMPMGEAYSALHKGIIEGAIVPAEVLKTYKLHEVTRNSTAVPMIYSAQLFVAMNKSKWNDLPKDLQNAFDSVAKSFVIKASTIWQQQDDAIVEWAKNLGHKFIHLSSNEQKTWEDLLKPLETEYIADLKSKGLPGEQIVSLAKKLSAENNYKYKK